MQTPTAVRARLTLIAFAAFLALVFPATVSAQSATGVIEGACRHLVKDRMERSGMRWSVEGAQPMLHIRAIHQSPDRDDFYEVRIKTELQSLYPHKSLIKNYNPCPA